MKNLILIQAEVKCPKGSFNSFGKYKYRTSEQQLEALKPYLNKYNCLLYLSDEIIMLGSKFFLKATAHFSDGDFYIAVYGYAEISEHKGMSSEQCTGTASSYARKHAINGLFLIDESETDIDAIAKEERQTLTNDRFDKAVEKIRKKEYTIDELKAKFKLNTAQEGALLLIEL
jgi:hypothetical protein